jgi:transposase
VEAIRALRVARRGAVKASTQTLNELQNLVLTAPESLRARLQGCSNHQRVDQAARFRPGDLTDPVEATKAALRCLARRHQELQAEIARLDAAIAELLPQAAPKEFLAKQGVGTQVAATLLVTVGDNAERITGDGSFAAVCGSSPVDCSSGKQQRHRPNPGGDRQANSAPWRIVRTRMQHDPRTRAYVERRTQEGKTEKEIIRCLERYVAREIYKSLIRPAAS